MVYPLVISAKEEDQELAKALINIPEEYRCFQVAPGSWGMPEGYMVLGVKQSDHYGWESVSILPERASGIKFYLGASHLDLFEAYGKSSFPAQAEELFIGYSTEGYKNPDYGFECQYDYSPIVKVLSSTKFPKLKELWAQLDFYQTLENGIAYSFPDSLLKRENMPSLNRVEFQGFYKLGETKRLEESLLWQKATKKFSEITESKMLAVDVHYQDNQAFVAGITFSSFSQSTATEVYYSQLEVPSEYHLNAQRHY